MRDQTPDLPAACAHALCLGQDGCRFADQPALDRGLRYTATDRAVQALPVRTDAQRRDDLPALTERLGRSAALAWGRVEELHAALTEVERERDQLRERVDGQAWEDVEREMARLRAERDEARAELAELDPAKVAGWIAERDDLAGALAITERERDEAVELAEFRARVVAGYRDEAIAAGAVVIVARDAVASGELDALAAALREFDRTPARTPTRLTPADSGPDRYAAGRADAADAILAQAADTAVIEGGPDLMRWAADIARYDDPPAVRHAPGQTDPSGGDPEGGVSAPAPARLTPAGIRPDSNACTDPPLIASAVAWRDWYTATPVRMQDPHPTEQALIDAVDALPPDAHRLTPTGDGPGRYAEGYAAAVAALRDDTRYLSWWSSTGVRPDGPVRRHLADYLETVGPPTPAGIQPDVSEALRRSLINWRVSFRGEPSQPTDRALAAVVDELWPRLDHLAPPAVPAADAPADRAEGDPMPDTADGGCGIVHCPDPQHRTDPDSDARRLLDQAIAVALPLSSGNVEKRLKALRRALAEVDAKRAAQNRPAAPAHTAAPGPSERTEGDPMPVPRCPSRIAHESGVVLGCQRPAGHIGGHRGGDVRWLDDDDRLITDTAQTRSAGHDHTTGYPTFAPDAELCVNTINGMEQWTGTEWNAHVTAATKARNGVLERLIICPPSTCTTTCPAREG